MPREPTDGLPGPFEDIPDPADFVDRITVFADADGTPLPAHTEFLVLDGGPLDGQLRPLDRRDDGMIPDGYVTSEMVPDGETTQHLYRYRRTRRTDKRGRHVYRFAGQVR